MTNTERNVTINSALPELIIIKYLLIYNNYNKYYKYIDKSIVKQKYPEIHKLYLTLEALHLKLTSEVKTLEEFELFFHASYPALKAGEKDAFDLLFKQLRSSEVSPESLAAVVEVLSERSFHSHVSEMAWKVSEGHADASELANLFTERSKVGGGLLSAKGKVETLDDSLEQLLNETMLKRGLRWPLACLNQSLGSLRLGDFGFVFARPETGKTTFLAHVGTHMAKQAKRDNLGPIAWANNEENTKKVKSRFYQAAYGLNKAQLLSDMRGIQERYENDIGKYLITFKDSIKHRRVIESILEDYRPSLFIIDQIDKVEGFDADRQDLVFGKIYQWARELAKVYCPIIGVCQASGEGEGVKWLTMNHVAEAKTSKQAEADWILGIGRTEDPETQRVRYLTISKNKLSGDDDTIEEYRHGRFEVLIHPEIARYEDVDLD